MQFLEASQQKGQARRGLCKWSSELSESSACACSPNCKCEDRPMSSYQKGTPVPMRSVRCRKYLSSPILLVCKSTVVYAPPAVSGHLHPVNGVLMALQDVRSSVNAQHSYMYYDSDVNGLEELISSPSEAGDQGLGCDPATLHWSRCRGLHTSMSDDLYHDNLLI